MISCRLPVQWFIAVLICLFVNACAWGQVGGPALPPQIFVFEAYDDTAGTLAVSQTIIANVTVTETRLNAAGVKEEYTVLVPTYRQQVQKYLLADAKISTVGGKELDRKEAAKLLKKGQPVILLTPSNKLPDAYKGLFRDEAIILEVKALGTPPEMDEAKPMKP